MAKKKDNKNLFLISIAVIVVALIAYLIGTQQVSKPVEQITQQTIPTTPTQQTSTSICGNDNYVRASGTSMAVPMVAGLIALLKEAYPSANIGEIWNAVKSGDDLIDYFGDNSLYNTGYGRINVTKAMYYLDITPPAITILSPVSSSSYYKLNVPLSFTVNKSTSWIGYSVDGKPNVTISGPVNLSNLSDGSHTITVYATDNSGNTGSSSVNFYYCSGDVNNDGKIDGKDIALVSSAFGTVPGDPRWNASMDINNDGKIEGKDQALIALRFGKACPASRWDITKWPNSIAMADFILSLQNSAGAIKDEPNTTNANEDSNMEYALIALGVAYNITKQQKYLTGLENGIAWLAAREEMTDPNWKGSWYYVYNYNPPYNPIPTSPGDVRISDVRGVDATSTLFVYLLYLHKQITGNNTLVTKYEANARAALDFVINKNLDIDGYSWSSWQKYVSDGQWHLWKYKYAADQGDVWLGLKAGALLYDAKKYGPYADFIKNNAPTSFYDSRQGRLATGIDSGGVKDFDLDGFDGIFPNGYLPWLWCSEPELEAAYNWLKNNVQPDGSIQISGGPKYALSVCVYGLAAFSLNHSQPMSSFQWLNNVPPNGPYDNSNGGVHDLPDASQSEYSNSAGFCMIALMGWSPFCKVT